MSFEVLLRDGLESLIVIAVGAMAVSAIMRIRRGEISESLRSVWSRNLASLCRVPEMPSPTDRWLREQMKPLPQGQAKTASVRSMFDTIAPRYELVNKVMTFGLDIIWRRRSMHYLGLPDNSLIADLACGTGDYCRLLTKAGHRPVGVDLSFGMLQAARTEAPLVHADACRLPFADGSLDGITSGFSMRNFVDLGSIFSEAARVTRPGGRIVVLDAYQPSFAPLRAGHSLYFGRLVPRIGGLLSDEDAYNYLPRSLSYLPPIDEILETIGSAGFRPVQCRTFSGGIVHMFTATRS